jgi:hypothetical protein
VLGLKDGLRRLLLEEATGLSGAGEEELLVKGLLLVSGIRWTWKKLRLRLSAVIRSFNGVKEPLGGIKSSCRCYILSHY